jgi:hypothetical protein
MSTEVTYRKAKVWNKGTEDYAQSVKGEKVFIPAGKSITVSRRTAIDIRGHYPGKNVIAKLEIEPIMEKIEVADEYVDHKTGKTFRTREDLLRHLGVDPVLASKPKGFECVICLEEFTNKDELVAHLTECVKKHAPKETAAAKK